MSALARCCRNTLTFLLLGLTSGSFSQAPDTLDPVVVEIYKPRTRTQRSLAYIQQRARHEWLRNPQLALKLNNEFTQKSIAEGEFEYAASGYNEIGYLYQERKMFYMAIEYFLKAYKMYIDHGLMYKTGYISIGIGNCYFHSGSYGPARDNYIKAERQFILERNAFGAAVAENNMGLVKQKLNDQDSALWFFTRALERRRRMNNPPLVGHSYYYLGTVMEARGDTSLARSYYTQAIGILLQGDKNRFLAHDFMSTIADCYTGLGNLQMSQKKYQRAVENYMNALLICDTISARLKTPAIYLAVGEAAFCLGMKNESLRFYQSALKVSDSIGLPAEKRDSYEAIMRYYLLNRNVDSAMICFKQYSEITDSIFANMMDSRYKEIGLSQRVNEIELMVAARQARDRVVSIFLALTGFLLLLLFLGVVLYIRRQKLNAKLATAEIEARKKAEAQLEKVNLELEERNSDKDRFISILSHDLRSPFSSILGFADLLVEETADKNIPEIMHYSRLLQQISRRTFQLLENLLAWSRLQMNNLPFQPSELDLSAEVSMAIDTMLVAASRKSIRLNNLVVPGISVFADANMLQTVLRNLTANAIKFTRSGGNVEIRSEPGLMFVTVTVNDSGTGIPPEIVDKLFTNSGGTISSPGTDNETGNGLGLVLCRHMVEKNGGTIRVASTSAYGTCISFTLPAHQGAS